jgi:hypothetical protein
MHQFAPSRRRLLRWADSGRLSSARTRSDMGWLPASSASVPVAPRGMPLTRCRLRWWYLAASAASPSSLAARAEMRSSRSPASGLCGWPASRVLAW